MSGFHMATICAECDPPVVAISTGCGSRCPRCGHVDEGGGLPRSELPDGALARQILRDTPVRSDGDARLLAELARRLLYHVEKTMAMEARSKELEEELAKLCDLADLVSDADISALPPELLAVKQRNMKVRILAGGETVAEDERDQLRVRLQHLEDKVDTAAQLLRAPVSGTMGKLMDLFADVRPRKQGSALPDLSADHVDRVARRLFRAFDDASAGREPPHDFGVMAECAYEGQPVADHWHSLAREAIQLGAVVPEETR